MKISKTKKFFKGKSVSYSTEVTATKFENILICTLFILYFIFVFCGFYFGLPFSILFLGMFFGIIIIVGIITLIVFSKKHKTERIENEYINGVKTINKKEQD